MVATVFSLADAAMGLMASVNLVAILLLSDTGAKLTKYYFEQRKQGVPRFAPDDCPELTGKIDRAIWANR